MEIVRQNCDFLFYYNKTDITPAVLDGSNKIILANWPADKHIICSINNDIPIFPIFPILIEVENNCLNLWLHATIVEQS